MNHAIRMLPATLLFAAVSAQAVPIDGQIDTSFGNQGTRTLSFTYPNTDFDYAHSVMVASDGKIVVVGTATKGNTFEGFVTLARLLPNGQPDTTFGSNGQLLLDIVPGGAYGIGRALLDKQDRVLLIGSKQNTTLNRLEPLVCRVSSNGSLDPSYGTPGTGCITVPFLNSAGGEFNGGALTADGSLIAVGDNTINGTTQTRGTFVKIGPTGVLDTSFVGVGGVGFGCGAALGCFMSNVAIGKDGRVVGAGYVQTSSTTSQFEIIALTSTGALDTTFNGVGGVSFGFGLVPSNETDQAVGVAIGPDGRIAAVGYAGIPANSTAQAAIVEFGANGTLDFATPLYLGTLSAQVSVGEAVMYAQDGKLLVGGATEITTTSDLSAAVVRLTRQGVVDPDFGNGFGALVPFNALFHNDAITTMAFQGTQLIVAGQASTNTPISSVEAVARLTFEGVFANGFE